MRQKMANLGFIGIVILLSILLFKSCEESNRLVGVNESLEEDILIKTNEKGQQEASISVLQLKNKKQLLELKSKDSTIIWLQDVVKDYKGKLNAAIVLSNHTLVNGSSVTNWLPGDTVYVDSVRYFYPTYNTDWENRWEVGSITAKRDSISWSIKVKNEYEIYLGAISKGWFKKRKYEVLVRNMNPNTYTTELRSFQVEEKSRRISLGIQAGYGLGLLDFKPTPYIGLGFQFNILNIK